MSYRESEAIWSAVAECSKPLSETTIGRRTATVDSDDKSKAATSLRSVAALQNLAEFPRRDFLKLALAGTAASAVAQTTFAKSHATPPLIDVNVTLGQWPTRRVRGDDTASLVSVLRHHQVTEGWAGSFEGLLYKDVSAINERLVAECRRHGKGLLLPFPCINPKSPDWQEDLRRCIEGHRVRGIRLYPNYHGYTLADTQLIELLRVASEHRLLVQLALILEDERMMHPLLRATPVDVTPLAAVLKEIPRLRVILLNALTTLRGQPLGEITTAGEVYVEISMLEGVGGIENLLTQIPAQRVLFGSYAPFFYFESAMLKLKESRLSDQERLAICRDNSLRLAKPI